MGVYIKGITIEMLRNAPLEAVENLLASGDMVEVQEPKPSKSGSYTPKRGEEHNDRTKDDSISRQAAIEAIWRVRNFLEHDFCRAELLDAIQKIPSTDRHGAWVYTYPHMRSVEEQRFLGEKNPKGPIPDKRFPVMVCSLCGGIHPGDPDNFCPNCGALMAGARKEDTE